MEVTAITAPRTKLATQQRSDADRLGLLYGRHSAGAARLAYVLTGDREVAQDVAHDAFVRMARRLFRVRDDEHARAYLYRTTINLCRDRGRKLRRERSALARVTMGSSENIPDLAGQDEVWQALQTLPTRQRAALYLRYYQDLSENEAANVLDCSVSAIKSLVNRGLRELRANMRVDEQ